MFNFKIEFSFPSFSVFRDPEFMFYDKPETTMFAYR